MRRSLHESAVVLTRDPTRDNPARVSENRCGNRENQDQPAHDVPGDEKVVVERTHEQDRYKRSDSTARLFDRQFQSDQLENITLAHYRITEPFQRDLAQTAGQQL